MLKVVIGAGGSGGHLFPAQQLAQKLQGEQVLFAGHGLSQSPFFEKEKIPFAETAAAPLDQPLRFAIATWKGFWQSVRLLYRFKPDVVVGFGSYHSFPLLLAALLMRKKIVLFEANCTPGKVNRLLKPFAKEFAVQFPQKGGTQVPFLPWKPPAPKLSMKTARERYNLELKTFTILVFGGSQGAAFLNELFPRVVPLLGMRTQVIHLTGKGNVVYHTPAVVKEFETEMSTAYAAADLVVCRSGAGTVAELIRFEKPAVLIPYPHAGAHQVDNAVFLKTSGISVVLQAEATAEKVAAEILALHSRLESVQKKLAKLKSQNKGLDLSEVVKRVCR